MKDGGSRLAVAQRAIRRDVARRIESELTAGWLRLDEIPAYVRAMARCTPRPGFDPRRVKRQRPSRMRREIESWEIHRIADRLAAEIARGMPRDAVLEAITLGGRWDRGLLDDCIVDVGAILAGMYFENAARCEVEATVALANEAAR